MLEHLKKFKIILGSASPRRSDLLAGLGVKFDTVVPEIDESIPLHLAKEKVAEFLANQKAKSLSALHKNNTILLTADTTVLHNDTILGKPRDHKEAIGMITLLGGKKHKVLTGVCISTIDRISCFTEVTEVHFAKISKAEAIWYVDQFEVMDKAGSYGIQDWIGMAKVSKIVGSYTNVMGLPTARVYQELSLFVM